MEHAKPFGAKKDPGVTEMLNLLLAILLPTSLGFMIVAIIFRRQPLDFLTSLALGYGVGFGCLSLWMLGWDWMGLKLDLVPLAVSCVGMISLIAILLGKERIRTALRSITKGSGLPKWDNDWISLIIILYVSLYLIYIFWCAFSIPVNVWDEIERVALKSKVFYFDRSLSGAKYLPHPSYPLQMELSLTWITLNLGAWSDQGIKIIVPFMLLAFLRVQYFFLRHFTTRRWSLAAGALLLSSPLVVHHATMVYGDLPLALNSATAIMMILLWHKTKNNAFLFCGAIFSGLSGWIKLEGGGHVLIHSLLMLYFLISSYPAGRSEKIRHGLKYLSLSWGVFLFYFAYKLGHGIPLGERFGLDITTAKIIQRMPVIMEAFIRNLFLSGNWSLLWILCVVSLCRYRPAKNQEAARVAIGLLFSFILLYFASFLFTPSFYWIAGDIAYTTFSRLILHFFPLVILIIVLLNGL